jgi:hypothetical protein
MCTNSLKPSGKFSKCTTCFNIQQLCVLPTEFIYVPRMIIRINNDYFPHVINQLIFEMEMRCFLFAVGTEFLNINYASLKLQRVNFKRVSCNFT